MEEVRRGKRKQVVKGPVMGERGKEGDGGTLPSSATAFS